jgi:hypothetical protein
MKKITFTVLSACAFLLSACGGSGSTQAVADSPTTAAAVVQAQTLATSTTSETSTTPSAVAAAAVDLTDAISILKMIVGLEVNSGGAPLTAYQAYAADVDGNGAVELTDAIKVLKRIVGLETATANWMFFNGTPTVADKLNPGLPASVSATVSNSTNVSMTAVLRGDVVSSSAYTYSWALTSVPSGSTATLASPTAASPSFKADVAGAYVATMTITDGSRNVSTSSVTLTATGSNTTTEPTPTAPLSPTIASVSSGNNAASVNFTAASTGTAATSFTATCTPANGTAVSAEGSASPISVTGLLNGTSYSCSVKAVNAVGSSAASTAMSVTTAELAYATPANFATAMERSFSGNLVAASSLVSRSRYMISDASSASSQANYLSLGATYNATTGYAAESATLPTSTTYADYLSKLFLVVAQGTTGFYRIDSHLHPNNSLDVDTTDGLKLKFRNNFGKATSLYGYLTFSYNSSTKLLQAKKRYAYSYTTSGSINTPTWTEVTPFSAADYYVNFTGGVYKLVQSVSQATPLYLYNSPIDLGVPSFMNPKNVAFVTNEPAPFMSKVTVAQTEGINGSIYRSVNAAYRSQVATPGPDANTKLAAETMLATIKTTVEASGGKLRYAPGVYTAYRDAALATKLVSDSISDGTPGQNLVPYVYFTNEKDASNVYHPFMVVVSYGNQASPNGLVDVPHPPGYGAGSYSTSPVTRFSNLENYVQMIPLRDYGQVTAVTDNSAVITKNLWTARTVSTLAADVYTYADEADNGILIDGSVMFPAYNNTLVPSHLSGELSASGCHVGQGGGGPHCHADGYQPGFGLALYNDLDYVNKSHPPLIGFGYDGIALFGRYRGTSDAGLLGYTTTLDDFGGHNHDGIGYHFHAHTVTDHTPVGQTAGSTYPTTMNVLMKGAYIGKVTTVPCFRAKTAFNTNKYLGGTVTASVCP